MGPDIFYNKLYRRVASRVSERHKDYDLRKLENITLPGLVKNSTKANKKFFTVHMNRFGQKGRPLEVKVSPVVKGIKNLKIFEKWLGVQSLELFAANSRSFQVKKIFSKELVTPAEEAHFI